MESAELYKIAKAVHASGCFRDVKNVDQAFVIIMYGHELGFGPMQSMQGISLISGKPAMGAHMIAATLQRGGYEYEVKERSDERCEIEFTRDGASVGSITFTIEEAKRAGLNSALWNKYPANMLYARAISNGARTLCASAFGGGVYTPEELISADSEDAVIVEEPRPVNGRSPDLAPPALVLQLKEAFERQGVGEEELAETLGRALIDVTTTEIEMLRDEYRALVREKKAAAAQNGNSSNGHSSTNGNELNNVKAEALAVVEEAQRRAAQPAIARTDNLVIPDTNGEHEW